MHVYARWFHGSRAARSVMENRYADAGRLLASWHLGLLARICWIRLSVSIRDMPAPVRQAEYEQGTDQQKPQVFKERWLFAFDHVPRPITPTVFAPPVAQTRLRPRHRCQYPLPDPMRAGRAKPRVSAPEESCRTGHPRSMP